MESQYKNKALEMAINDFETFCNYTGVNQIQFKVCFERSKGKSLMQIALKLEIPKTTVKNNCDRCFVKPYKESKKEKV